MSYRAHFFSPAQPSSSVSWLSPSVPFNLRHPIQAAAGCAKEAGRVSDHPGEEKTRGQRQSGGVPGPSTRMGAARSAFGL